MLNTWRQNDIINPDKIKGKCLTVVGAGAIGSFTVLSLAKLGVQAMRVYDEDGVSEHNLPNQFFRVQDAQKESFKVEALKEIVKEFGDMTIEANKQFYTGQLLEEMVIGATDSMSSRRMVWEEFKKQDQCKVYIDARMGGEIARMYQIRKDDIRVIKGMDLLSQDDVVFYEETLYTDAEAAQLPCTARAVVYNVLMIASLICRSFKAVVNQETWPREIIFNMAQMEEPSLVYMTRV